MSDRRAKERRCLVLLDGAGMASGAARGKVHAFSTARDGVRQDAVHDVPGLSPDATGNCFSSPGWTSLGWHPRSPAFAS